MNLQNHQNTAAIFSTLQVVIDKDLALSRAGFDSMLDSEMTA